MANTTFFGTSKIWSRFSSRD